MASKARQDPWHAKKLYDVIVPAEVRTFLVFISNFKSPRVCPVLQGAREEGPADTERATEDAQVS